MQGWNKCPAGTYSSQTADSVWACQPCPEQMYCPMRLDEAVEVSDGYWSDFGVHLPLPVQAGFEAGPNRPLAPCKPGYYSDDFAGFCIEC